MLDELTPAKVAAEKATIEGTMGAKAKQAGLIARTTDLDGANRASRNTLLQMEVTDRKRLGELYDSYLSVVNDEQMPDAAKEKKLAPITNAIQAIKAKSAPAGAGRNPELDTEKVTEKRMNQDSTTTKIERTQRRKAGGIQEPESGDPVLAEARAAIAAGADYGKVEARLQKMGKSLNGAAPGGQAKAAPQEQTRKDPISGSELTRKEWDKKYGKGDFDNLYRKGEDSLKAF